MYSELMAITLTPELEEIVRTNASVSGFRSPEEYLYAVLTDTKDSKPFFYQSIEEIRAAIDEGWEQARRGKLVDSETVWSRLEEHKSKWRAERAG